MDEGARLPIPGFVPRSRNAPPRTIAFSHPHAPAASELGAEAPGTAFPRRAWAREININLAAIDLESLETLAQQSGISVSLLMSTVLHQFVASRSV